MSSSIKVRATLENDTALIRALIRHPMENGRHKDEITGELIPLNHITEVLCTHNGRPVMTCHLGPGVSRNPSLSFKIKPARTGDALALSWQDNLGGSDQLEVAI
ncbi:MAG TPA: thiosulfate oxidation carrier complex protein SoxZ [Gammaproteobacteria bacterium]|nr:thiosulfate oxidation carrier complex protein SoxZ [Gammaproteobacteria bacterium]